MQMNKTRCFCLLVLATATLSVAGCKVQITVPEGGRVISTSGAYECQSGQVCTIGIHDLFFDEEFVGEPAPGYRFVEWRRVKRGLCQNLTAPCRIVSAWAQIHEVFIALLESDAVFYLEPAFVTDPLGTTFSGLTSDQLPIALTVRENAIVHLEFTYQQLGEIPPDPDCRHEISVDLSVPVNVDGGFDVDVSLPPQVSDSGKLRMVAFDGRFSGSLGNTEGAGRWEATELDIFCEKSNGETLHNFCGEGFFPCLDAFDFQFNIERVD